MRWLWLVALLPLLTACPQPPGPPQVVATDPEEGAVGVRLDRAYVAEFSLPLDPASLSSGAIEVRVDGAQLGFDAELKDDRRVLEIRLTEDPGSLPAEVEIRLTDALLGENGEPIVPHTWRFTLADWIPLANGLEAPGAEEFWLSGDPLAVAWSARGEGGAYQAYARRWATDEETWRPLGDHLPGNGPKVSPALCADGEGVLHAFWRETREERVKTSAWTGGGWTDPVALQLSVDAVGSLPSCSKHPPLVAAWNEYDDSSSTFSAYAARWSEWGWEKIAATIHSTAFPDAFTVYAVAAGGGRIQAAYQAQPGGSPESTVSEWDGSRWNVLGGPLEGDGDPGTGAQTPRLVHSPDGDVFAAWIEGGRAYVARWDGSGWQFLPSPGPARSTDLDAGTRPVVLRIAPGEGRVYVQRYVSGGWVTLGGPLGEGVLEAQLALTAAGTPVVALTDGEGLRVYRYNRVRPY